MKFKSTNAPKVLAGYMPKLAKLFDKYFENLLGDSWISVNFVDDKKMQELNSNYRKLEYSTDVLSFPFVFVDKMHGKLDKVEELGELYISEIIVSQNAKKYNVEYEEELLRVLIHGALHILGYEHLGNLNEPMPEDNEMFEMQEFLLKELYKK